MRKDWEYKKLGECTNIEYGTRVVQKKDGGTIYPVYGGGGETFRIDKYNRENCLIIARFAMSKCCVRYVNGRFFLNDSGLSVKASNYFHQDFLNHCMVSLNDTIYNLGKGAAQRNLDIKAFKQIPIPIPPKPTQLAIVAELDKINELIQLKKEQLKDYDQLAQSIFYEMFGDPVENEKGWEVKKLGEISKNYDSQRKPITASDREAGIIPYYGASGIVDYVKDYIFNDNYLLISEDGANLVARTTPIAFPISGKTWVNNHAHILKFTSIATQLYVQALINIINIEKYITGAVQPKLTKAKLNSIPVPLPPLPLQQQFAARIEAIERQKQQVSETIKDLETLLASRMQYWFD